MVARRGVRASALTAVVGAVVLTLVGGGPAQAAACGPAAPLRFEIIDMQPTGYRGAVFSVGIDGTFQSSVPMIVTGIEDIAMRADETGYWGVDSATGELKSIDAVTGAITSTGFFAPPGSRGLVRRPDGHLVTDDGSSFYDLDPATGVVTPLGMTLPNGWVVEGDYTLAPDGRLLVSARDSSLTGRSELVAFDFANPSAPVALGLIPQTTAMATFDGAVYLGTASGDVESLTVIPVTAAAGTVPTTVIHHYQHVSFLGAAALAPVACAPAVTTATTTATASPASAPVASETPLPTLASTGISANAWSVIAVFLLIGGMLLTRISRRSRSGTD